MVEKLPNTTMMNMTLTLFTNNDSHRWGQFHVKMIKRIIKMIDRLTACMQEGYNSNANQIFSLLHQINNLFIMQLPLLTFFSHSAILQFLHFLQHY